MGVKVYAKPRTTPETDRALRTLSSTITNIGNRYQVGLLWKDDVPSLPDNRPVALRRLFALENRFRRNPELAKNYASVLNKYITLGHTRKLSCEELTGVSGRVNYLPHHSMNHPANQKGPV